MPTQINETVLKSLPLPETDQRGALYWFKGAMVEGRQVPPGFGVMVTRNGVRSFVLNYRIGAMQRRMTIGRWPAWTVVAAVREARALRQRVDRGNDPLAELQSVRKAAKPQPKPAEKTVADVIDEFLKAHVERRLRRPRHYSEALLRLVKPAIGSVPIYGLRRSHIAAMLNKIEDANGTAMADHTLSYLRSGLNWYAVQDDEFAVPQLKGLRRGTGGDRDRVLNDDEIRAVWQAAEGNGVFGAVVRLLLLTGQRRGDVYGMTWDELDGKGNWTIPARRYKTGRLHHIPLSKAAMEIIAGQPRTGPLVFQGRNGDPLTGGNNRKEVLDRMIAVEQGEPLKPWTIHDLRRTSRTLMARAGVRPDIAERVVGHTVGNSVGRIYDRHTYEADKRVAMEALARLIAEILDPQPSDKVVSIRGAGR